MHYLNDFSDTRNLKFNFKEMKIFICWCIIFQFFFIGRIEAQNNIQNAQSYKHCDTVSKKKFDKLVKSYYRTMNRKEQVSIQEIIDIVRIYISIPVTKYPEGEKKYIQFIDLYKERYMGMACDMLGCIPLRGVTAYSKEYDLYLSFTKKDSMACYNYFLIK